MNLVVAEIRINVRTTADIKRDIEIAARLRGMTVSSLINSLAVKAIREEKNLEPEAFKTRERVRNVNEKSRPARPLAPVVAHIGPADAAAAADIDEVRRMISDDEVAEIESRLRPRRTRNVAVLKEKAR
jgi:hypothetical protein